jgi:hypothetical protein
MWANAVKFTEPFPQEQPLTLYRVVNQSKNAAFYR